MLKGYFVVVYCGGHFGRNMRPEGNTLSGIRLKATAYRRTVGALAQILDIFCFFTRDFIFIIIYINNDCPPIGLEVMNMLLIREVAMSYSTSICEHKLACLYWFGCILSI